MIGVEGSQLVHGVNVLQPGGALLALQPPNRFVSYYKYHTDRDNQHFAYVVGTPMATVSGSTSRKWSARWI